MGATALFALAACSETLDLDLRPPGMTTTEAAMRAVADRPEPDARGVISYPNYQVAVARRGDRLADVAERVGLPAGELARYNGVQPDTPLRQGEIVALPRRVAEASAAPGSPRGNVDVAALAGPAIDSAAPARVETQALPSAAPSAPAAQPRPSAPETDEEPIRHRVERGETAYSIARLYDVSVRSLAEWNGLGPDFSVREGQHLLIPVALEPPRSRVAVTEDETPPPGTGSPTPPPPSASQPLPEEEPAPAAQAAPAPPSPELGEAQTAATSEAEMVMPVDGPIIREFARGRNNGIAIAADPGTPVRAAAAGQVAAVTENTEEVSIVVIKHPDNLLTVYVNLDDIAVSKGDSVSRGDQIAAVAPGSPSFLHFEVTRGTERVDPMPYLSP
ncbi:M23 family metallopeptidase [Rhodosalinus halophilus]|nr:M23 family metallopeptidase [Rhodosalinus halophilus]